MFRLPTARLGRLLGIPIEVNASWLVIFLLISGVLAFDLYPSLFPGRPVWVDVAGGLVSSLLFFTSLVAHEFSHSLVARRYGIRVERITLFIFGGVAQLSEEPRTPGREIAMSLAGPGMSLTLAAAFGAALTALLVVGAGDGWWAPAAYLAAMNLGLALFNLTPAFPMDGGRVLRAFLWWATGDKRSATFVASGCGVAAATVLAGAGSYLVVDGDLSGAWIVLVAVFLARLAIDGFRLQSGRLRMANTPVGAVPMLPLPVVEQGTVHAWSPVGVPHPALPLIGIIAEGLLVGVVPFAADARAEALAPDARMLRDPALFIDVRDSAETALSRFDRGATALVAVDRGRAVGVVTPGSLAS